MREEVNQMGGSLGFPSALTWQHSAILANPRKDCWNTLQGYLASAKVEIG